MIILIIYNINQLLTFKKYTYKKKKTKKKKTKMEQLKNNRRGALESARTKVVQSRQASPDSGYEIRGRLYRDLSQFNKRLLEEFSSNKITEQNQCMVCELNISPNSANIAINTDTFPRGAVTGIIGLSKIDRNNKFYLPVNIVPTKEWTESLLKFDQWLYCRVKYLTEDKYNKSIKPNNNIMIVSEYEFYEMYTTTLATTLGEYYRTGDTNLAKMCWLLIWNIHNKFVTPTRFNLDDLLMKVDQLEQLILKRDESIESAKAYKTFINACKVQEYYWLLFNLMMRNQEIVHKSHLMNLDTFIFGLLSQSYMTDTNGNNIGVTFNGIDDNILRMIIERSMHTIKATNIMNIMTMPDLVTHLHQNAGINVENSLKYWTFMTETYKILLAEKCFSVNGFITKLNIIKDNINSMNGILPFCFTICPPSVKYLTNESIAEFILTCVLNNTSKKVLSTSLMVSSSTTYSNLSSVLEKNNARAEEIQRNLSSSSNISKDIDKVWYDFLSNTNSTTCPYLLHSKPVEIANFKLLLVKYAKSGTEDDLHILRGIIDKASNVNSPIIGLKRARNIILLFAPVDSAVFNYYGGNINEISNNGISMRKSYQVIRDALQQLDRSKTHEMYRTTESIVKIEFISFELACEIRTKTYISIQDGLASIKMECPICMEDIEQRDIIALHDDERHFVCRTCRPQLHDCPFCRRSI